MKLIFKIKKPCDFLFSQLSDMQKFVLVHPVISKIEPIAENNYLIHETLKLAFLPYSFTYPVSVDCHALDKTIHMRAKVMKLVNIEIIFVLKTVEEFTEIEETVEFRSLLPVKFVMEQIFKKQHKFLFENIERLE